MLKLIIPMLVTALLAISAVAAPISAIGYNIEGGYLPDANPKTVANFMGKAGQADIWGLSEVTVSWIPQLIDGAGGRHYKAISTEGAIETTDALAILYDTNKLELIESKELLHIKRHQHSRAPLVATFQEIATGKRFEFMVNHLERKREHDRNEQAKLLNTYGRETNIPIVAMGDYNFDWSLKNHTHNQGYTELTKAGVFTWEKPQNMIMTSCARSYNSILDFALYTNGIKPIKSNVLLAARHYCYDDKSKPDHRPVLFTFEL